MQVATSRATGIQQCELKACSSSVHESSDSLTENSYQNISIMYERARRTLAEGDRIEYEARLIRALCRQLINNSCTVPVENWLQTIGLAKEEWRHISMTIKDVQTLVGMDTNAMIALCEKSHLTPESRKKLILSTENIKKYLDTWQGDQSEPSEVFTDKQLSWTVSSPTKERWSRKQTTSHSSSQGSPGPASSRSNCSTPAGMTRSSFLDSPGSPSVEMSNSRVSDHSPSSELCVNPLSHTLSPTSPLSAQSTPSLAPSHSRTVSTSSSMNFFSRMCRKLSLSSPKTPSQPLPPYSSVPYSRPSPKSPKSSSGIGHNIPHRWARKNSFRLTDNPCSACGRPLGFGFFNSWERCRNNGCTMKVHTYCKSRMGDTCGLKPEHAKEIIEKLINNMNKQSWGSGSQTANPTVEKKFVFPDPNIGDSSSSTNSSAPSTPAMLNLCGATSPYINAASRQLQLDRFQFPVSVPEVPDIVLPDTSDDQPCSSNSAVNSVDSDSTVHDTLKVEGSEGTLGAESQGSSVDPGSSTEVSPASKTEHTWDRNRWNMSTIRGQSGQSSWSDVTIPFVKIQFKKGALLGNGRFSKVYRGYHFGDVAVKLLNMDHVPEEIRLEEFKKEVASFKSVRHDNIVLFMGYCLEKETLAIVTGLCKGKSLHNMIHENGEKIELSSAVQYAMQICQGMSYLHTKKIIHRDLRSKNIFIEKNQKVVITDLGLFNMERLRLPMRSNTLVPSQFWLSYLAPELIRALTGDWSELPFSEQSDMYSFGTIWYELLAYEMPFRKCHSDEIIFKVANGVKAPIIHMNVPREVKDILIRCWAYLASDRPSFLEVHAMMGALPKKRLDRSPSFPTIRSYESMF